MGRSFLTTWSATDRGGVGAELRWVRRYTFTLPNFVPGTCTYVRKLNPMLRTAIFLLTVASSLTLFAQSKDPLAELSGATGQRWSIIGGGAADAACKAGDGVYTFQAKPAQVVVKECAGGAWKSRTEAITTWSANGKSGIAFGGAKYEVKTLPATAPACEGNGNCVRLVTVPDGKTDATRTIYLAH